MLDSLRFRRDSVEEKVTCISDQGACAASARCSAARRRGCPRRLRKQLRRRDDPPQADLRRVAHRQQRQPQLQCHREPVGSTTLKGPITLSFGGPVPEPRQGQAARSPTSTSASARCGKTGSLRDPLDRERTATSRCRATTISFRPQPSRSSNRASRRPRRRQLRRARPLSKLGIDPLRWLVKPDGGRQGERRRHRHHPHPRRRQRGGAAPGPQHVPAEGLVGRRAPADPRRRSPPPTRNQIASEVKNPSFDVWTGKSDKTVRKLSIKLTMPVTGQISTLLGGLSSRRSG